MMKSVPDRRYTAWFREDVVRQVLDGGRTILQAARSLEMSEKTLGNRVRKARRGESLVKCAASRPVDDLQAENARLRHENARLKLERDILRKAAAYSAKESL